MKTRSVYFVILALSAATAWRLSGPASGLLTAGLIVINSAVVWALERRPKAS